MRHKFQRHQKHSSSLPNDHFVSTAKEKEIVQIIQDEVKDIIKECYPDTDAFVEKIEALGLPVIAKTPDLQLKLSMMVIGVQPGFVVPTFAQYDKFAESLQKYVPQKAHMDFSFGMIILPKDEYQFSFLAYQFYHWMAFKKGLPGYQGEAQRLYSIFSKKYGGQLNPKFLEKLDYDQTVFLRMAIRRDKEALQFMRHMLQEVFIPMNNAKLLDKGEAQA